MKESILVDISKFNDGDLLIFNAEKKCFEAIDKKLVYRDLEKEVEILNATINTLKQSVLDNRNNIVKISKIIKETLWLKHYY